MDDRVWDLAHETEITRSNLIGKRWAGVFIETSCLLTDEQKLELALCLIYEEEK
jgi:hypothetical protein